MIGKRKIDFTWVKGHAGNPLNEQCDKMAVEAAKTLKGTYKKGTVKQENKADKTQKEQPSLSFVVSKVNAADLDLHKMLEENKKYLLIPSAAYFPQTRSGKYTVLMDYCGTRKVISGDCEEHDPNGVFLRGIFAETQWAFPDRKKVFTKIFFSRLIGAQKCWEPKSRS